MKTNNLVNNESLYLNEISPISAWEIISIDKSSLLIDVRSTMEYFFIGHPKGATHIPWMDEPDWSVNPEFIKSTISEIAKVAPFLDDIYSFHLILICRSGHRSIESGTALLNSGFYNISYVSNGFEGELDENSIRSNLGGWRFEQLPWEQC